MVTAVGVYGGLLMPLVYTRSVAYPFIFPKMLFFQVLVGLAFPAWVVLASHKQEYRPSRSRMLIGVLVWFAAMGLSTILGASPRHSFFATQERMTGLFALLHFLAWFAMASSVFTSARHWRRLLEFQIAVGFVAACLTFLVPHYPSLIGMGGSGVGGRLSGLFGNPIFAAAYQNFNIFFVIFLWQGASARRRGWYVLVLAACVASLVAAGSRGPMLGLVVGLAVTALVLAVWGGHRRFVWFAAGSLACVVSAYAAFLVFVAQSPALEPFWANHANLQHFFQFSVDVQRIRLWTAAWDGFVARPVLGWGPLNYEVMLDVFYRPEFHTLGINDEPHNWLLGVVSETGLLGLLAFGTMWVTFFWSLASARRTQSLSPIAAAALMGAGAGHFVQNVMAFDSPVTNLTTYLVFAIAAASSPLPQKASNVVSAISEAFRKWSPTGAVPAIMVGVVLIGSILPGFASVYAQEATKAFYRGNPDEMLALMTRSQRLATPYHDDQLRLMTQSILLSFRQKKFEHWSKHGESLALIQRIAEKQSASMPSHNRLRRAYARLLAVIGAAEGDRQMMGKAERLYRQNIADSPKRQQYIMDHAQYLAETGKLDEAESLYRRAMSLDPSIGEPRWELGKFMWMYRKQPDDGARMMVESYDKYPPSLDAFGPRDSLEWQQMAQVCARAHQLDKLRGITQAVRNFGQADRPTEAHLAIAGYMEQAGLLAERDQVLTLARDRNPKVAALVAPVLAGEMTLRTRRSGNATPRQLPGSGQRAKTAQVSQEPRVTLAQAP
jgi:O-antigen ligase